MNSTTPRYDGHPFPAEIISHAVWLYHRFMPEEAGQLRFRVGGQRYDYAIPGWSLPEIFVYRTCQP